MADVDSPAVSAVLALFNGREFLREAVRSVALQTFQVSQLIIVDDGSSDGSVDFLSDVLSDFPDLAANTKIVVQDNAGQGHARNKGVQLATGEFVAFIDQDDTWEPRHIEILLLEIVDSKTTGWVYSDFNEINSLNQTVRRHFLKESKYRPPQKSVFSLVSFDLMMLPTASLIRKAAFTSVQGFDTQFRGFEDDDLFFRMFVEGWDFTFCPQSVSNYRIHENNSSRGLSFPESRMKFYRKHKNHFSSTHPYFNDFYNKKLVGRITSSILRDAWAAKLTSNSELLNYSHKCLLEIYSESGWNSKRRLQAFFTQSMALMAMGGYLAKIKAKLAPRSTND